jgi:hypothetical protein
LWSQHKVVLMFITADCAPLWRHKYIITAECISPVIGGLSIKRPTKSSKIAGFGPNFRKFQAKCKSCGMAVTFGKEYPCAHNHGPLNRAVPQARRGGRVVECGGLENRCRLTPTQGSNPCLSALWHYSLYSLFIK